MENGCTDLYDASALPQELLQALGSHLSPAELRSARLACKPWATALAVCMPAMTMALPQQASGNVFRQPLVLCSSGHINSAQSVNYSAVPRLPLPTPAAAAAAAAIHPPMHHHRVTGRSITRPSPFATKGGQALAPVSDLNPSGLHPSPFIHAVASLPPGMLARMDNTAAAAAGGNIGAAPTPGTTVVQPQLQCQDSGIIQSWSSLPSSGLRTCSSLQQLHLQLSGAPPTPQDLLDLSNLPHLTHLTFRQLDLLPSAASCQPVAEEVAEDVQSPSAAAAAMAAAAARKSPLVAAPAGIRIFPNSGSRSSPSLAPLPSTADLANAAAAALEGFHISSPLAASSSSSSSYASAQPSSRSTSSSSLSALDDVGGSPLSSPAAASNVSEHSHWGSVDDGSSSSSDANDFNDLSEADDLETDDTHNVSDQQAAAAAAAGAPEAGQYHHQGLLQQLQQQPCYGSSASRLEAVYPNLTAAAGSMRQQSQQTECVSCSVITPQHVEALAKLPYLSSLELHPKQGSWDAAATAALLQLTMLTGLTRLSLTWGVAESAEAAAAAAADGTGSAAAIRPMTDAAAVEQAHGPQLQLQQCLVGLQQLQELELRGCAVVDVAILQRLQQLRVLRADALKVVNSDVLLKLQQQQQQQQAGSAAAAAGGQAGQGQAQGGNQGQQQHPEDAQHQQAAAAPEQQQQQQQQQQQRSPKWGVLPQLEQLHITHPASDISVFLQGTQTPKLSQLGFVTRGPSGFARLLGQHGKLKVLHLVFPDDEPWHPIAVVRLPTALPSLRSLTLEGRFWLPNSLIVALGVMEVPIEELVLKCKLAPPCLDRLQHLKQLQRLVLHHVPWTGRPAEGLETKDIMLQLPAKLLPPQLRDLEITNGWIQQQQ